MREGGNMVSALREDYTRLEARIDLRFGRVEERLDRLDDRMSRQFMWVVGVQVTTLIAVVSTLLARS